MSRVAHMASFLDLPVDALGDIGAFLCSADRRTLSRVSRGLRNTAVSLWPDDVAVSLKRRILRAMGLDAAFCALVRNTLLFGPLSPLPIHAVVGNCCNKRDGHQTIASAADGFAIERECGVCSAQDPLSRLPVSARELACVAGFYRVDVAGLQSLKRVSAAQLSSVNTLVLQNCGVSDIACLGQSETLRKILLSQCDHVTALPHIRFLQQAGVRRCHALTSVDVLAHAREVVLEGCEDVRDVSPLASVHTVTIERRKGLTDVSALFLGRVHSLVLDSLYIRPLPEGARTHSLTLFAVRVLRGHQLPSEEHTFALSRQTSDVPYESVDLARLSVTSLSLSNSPLPPYDGVPAVPIYVAEYTPRHGFDALAATMASVRLTVWEHFDISWACRLSRVVIEIGYRHSPRADVSLAPLANVRYVTVRGCDMSVHGLLAAVASVMREAPNDVRVQRHGCGALAGRRWSIGCKSSRFRDGSYASAVLAAIASFLTDDEIVHCGVRSLATMIAPYVEFRSIQCDPEWVAVARACLGRDGLPPVCVAAALSLLFKAAMGAYCRPADEGAQEVRDALPLDEMAGAAVRAARAWPDHVTVLEAAAQALEFCASMPRLAGRQRATLDRPSWARLHFDAVFPEVVTNVRQDRSWVSTAVGVALALAQRCLVDPRVSSLQLPMDLFAAVADIDRSCARELVEAGVLDMLLECAAAPPDRFPGLPDYSWIVPLGRLAQYACDEPDTHSPALVAVNAMLDVARHLSPRAIADIGRIELLQLLFAGVSPFPSLERSGSVEQDLSREEGLLLRAMNRHRFDCDLETTAALACFSIRGRYYVPRDILTRLSTYVARSLHPQLDSTLALLSVEGGATAIGRAGGGSAFLSAVLRASRHHERDQEYAELEREKLCTRVTGFGVQGNAELECGNFCKLALGLCELVASSEDGGLTDAVDMALENCVACLGTDRLWDPDNWSCLHDIARAASLLLFAKCRPDRGAVAPTTLCALAATAAVGLKLLSSKSADTTEFKVGIPGGLSFVTSAMSVWNELYVSVEAIAEHSACEGVRASGRLLSQTARMVSPSYEWRKGRKEGGRRVATVDDGAAGPEVRVARSLLEVVARGGLLAAAKAKEQSVGLTHGTFMAAATILSLNAMDDHQRASLVEDVPHTMHVLRRLWATSCAPTSLDFQAASVAALDKLQKLLVL